MWLILGTVGLFTLAMFFKNLSRSHKSYPNVWEYEFRAWHIWDQAASLVTAIGAFAGIILSTPLFEYYQKVPGEANDILMPALICLALLVPGAILGSIAQAKKKDAGIK
jgi:hypothetical protein